jgi:dimethylhistidine N-methyltransferase
MRTIVTPSTVASPFAEDVRHYLQLTPRQLPSQYLYDSLGSALFDAICEMPWYGITRAENRLLASHRQEIFARLDGLTRIVELGPGDGRKLQTLVEGTSDRLTAHLVDISAGALARAAHTLSDAFHVAVVTHQASFEEGLDAIARDIRRAAVDDAGTRPDGPDGRTLVLLLGSNIGNFDPPVSVALLGRIHASVARGDALLMGADLVKPERDLLLAYDDPLGVSAAFNLNVLLRINRELAGDFDLRSFRHRAAWNAACSRMEMSAVSTKAQRVRIEGIDLDLDLEDGEAIWTESSYKYTVEGLIDLLESTGFEPAGQWVDREGAFALTLARRI